MSPEVTKILLNKSIIKTFGSKLEQYYNISIPIPILISFYFI
jgi:hypothetical protein